MIKLSALVLSSVMFSGLTHACTKPVAPELPDAATAVTAQMVKAKNQVQAYMAAAEAYLECAASTVEHNRTVKSMKKVGEGFNEAVRSYKDRMSDA